MILGGNDGTHTDIRNNAVRVRFPAFPGKRMIAGRSVLRRQKRFSRLLALIKRWPPQAVSVFCIFRGMAHRSESVAKRRPKSSLSRHPKNQAPHSRPTGQKTAARNLLAPRSQPLLSLHQKTRSASLPFSPPITRKLPKSPAQTSFAQILTPPSPQTPTQRAAAGGGARETSLTL